MNTTENNKLIAEFMGAKVIKGLFSSKEGLDTSNMDCYVSLPKHITLGGLKFHTSWDWLMPVVEKIESEIGVNITIGRMFCEIDYTDPLNINKCFSVRIASGVKINATCEALVKFIKWYNMNSQS